MAKYTFVVLSNSTTPGQEAEYNEWYNKIHIPDVLNVPGFVAAQRFKVADAQLADRAPAHRYLALYEIDGGSLREVEPLRLATRPEVEAHESHALIVGPEVNRWFPAGRVILLFHGVQSLRVIRPGFREMVAVNRDPADPCDHPAEVFVVRVQLGRKYQHGMVQGELGFRRRALPQSLNTLRNPVVLLLRLREFGSGNRDHEHKNNAGKSQESHMRASIVDEELDEIPPHA